MKKLSKIVSRQDVDFKLTPSSSNETSINLPLEISNFISDKSGEVAFRIYKQDLLLALSYICILLPLYHKKDTSPSNLLNLYTKLLAQIQSEFGERDSVLYTVGHLKRDDGRNYLNGLKLSNGFTLRSFLIEKHTQLDFCKDDKGEFSIRVVSSLEELDAPIDVEEISVSRAKLDEPLQQIFFGAPGTGKSHRINEMCAEYENYRTTFHPDTDYASFVGSYKPITQPVVRYDIYSKPIKDADGKEEHEDRIVYRYVFQAFLKAYIAAWKEQQNENPKPVFLVVEEINRGNCAQIFGDIFQLLDRNEAGYSDYPIVADDDLAQELKREFEDLEVANPEAINSLYKGGKDVVESVKSGKRLLLPNNLYIWATMNTSDQSLFPIDSAFKRRWDWKYVKIKDSKKGYRIVFSNGNVYDWWSFVTEINKRIEGGEIQQEDKKLGYFFAKSKDGIITADRFLSKVIFYLYNDVFKDFGLDEDYFKGADGNPMTFASYFDEEGEADEAQIERFLTNLGLEPLPVEADDEPQDRVYGLTVNDRKMVTITQAVWEILSEAAKGNPFAEIEETVAVTFPDRADVVKEIDNPDSYQKENRWNKTPIMAKDGTAFVVSNQWHKESMPQVKELANYYKVPFEYDYDGEREYSLVVKWPDGDVLSLPSKNTTYVKALERIGIDRAAEGLKGRYRLKDVPVISKSKSPKVEGSIYNYVKVEDWYVMTGIDNQGSNLRLLSDTYNLGLEVTGE